MTTIMRLHRLRQPRSNPTTHLLFAITLLVFALIADTAVEQQRQGRIATGMQQLEEIRLDVKDTVDVDSMVPRFRL